MGPVYSNMIVFRPASLRIPYWFERLNFEKHHMAFYGAMSAAARAAVFCSFDHAQTRKHA